MKQFIRYLYEYEQGKRVRNVGFVRVEQTEEADPGPISMGRDCGSPGTGSLGSTFFMRQIRNAWGIPQGILENVNPAVNYRLRFTREDTGVPENYARIDGVILEAAGRTAVRRGVGRHAGGCQRDESLGGGSRGSGA